jgi:SH3 domain-containing YSC84-like protein 1
MSLPVVGKSYRNRKAVLFLLLSLAVVGFTVPSRAGDKGKDEETLTNAGNVLQDMLNHQSIPQEVISKADCILILPSVKKFSVGIAGSGGRGPLVCRGGSSFTGKWSAPAMYSVGSVSAGLQLGGTSTDYVLLIMTEKGVNAVLNGNTKLGRDAAAAAGPSGANSGAVSGNDILTYGRSKGCLLESRWEQPRSIPIVTPTSVYTGNRLHLARSSPAITFSLRPPHKECFPCSTAKKRNLAIRTPRARLAQTIGDEETGRAHSPVARLNYSQGDSRWPMQKMTRILWLQFSVNTRQPRTPLRN